MSQERLVAWWLAEEHLSHGFLYSMLLLQLQLDVQIEQAFITVVSELLHWLPIITSTQFIILFLTEFPSHSSFFTLSFSFNSSTSLLFEPTWPIGGLPHLGLLAVDYLLPSMSQSIILAGILLSLSLTTYSGRNWSGGICKLEQTKWHFRANPMIYCVM